MELDLESAQRAVAPVLCHNDLHEHNFLVEHAGTELLVTGVIDVENAVAADPLLDLARTLCLSVRKDRTVRDALLEGYGDLGPAAEERLRVYSVCQLLELWCWFASAGRPADILDGVAAELSRLATRDPARAGV